MPEQSILQLGAVAILFLVGIREFFSYLKSKKNGNGFDKEILKELQTMNNNHLHELKDAIIVGNERLINTIHEDNIRIVEALGEIKGRLK